MPYSLKENSLFVSRADEYRNSQHLCLDLLNQIQTDARNTEDCNYKNRHMGSEEGHPLQNKPYYILLNFGDPFANRCFEHAKAVGCK